MFMSGLEIRVRYVEASVIAPRKSSSRIFSVVPRFALLIGEKRQIMTDRLCSVG